MADSELEQPQEFDMDSAASAIEALLGNAPSSEQDQKPQNPPQEAPAQQAQEAQPADPEQQDEPVQDAPDIMAPEVKHEPAKAAPESPELSQRLQEADQKTKDAEAARSRYLEALNTYVPQLEAAIRGEFADIKTFDDLQKVAQTDPDRYNRFVIANAQLQESKRAQDVAMADERKAAETRHREWQNAEMTKLGKLLPDLNDPDKGPVLAKKLQDYALRTGYTQQHLAMASANDFVTIHKAMQFDNLQQAQKIAKEKAAKAPPVQQPGTARNNAGKEDKVQTDFERLQRNPDSTDAAAAMFRHFQ